MTNQSTGDSLGDTRGAHQTEDARSTQPTGVRPGLDATRDPSSLEAITTGQSRRVHQLSLGRHQAANLVGGVDRPLPEMREQLGRALESPEFRVYLERALEVALPPRHKAAIEKFYAPEGLTADASLRVKLSVLVSELTEVTRDVLDKAQAHYQQQLDRNPELPADKQLKPEGINLNGIFELRKVARTPVKDFVAKRFLGEEGHTASIKEATKLHDPLSGELRKLIGESLANALAATGEVQRFDGALRQYVNIRALRLDWLERSRSLGEAKVMALAEATKELDPAELRRFLLEVDSVPRLPLTYTLQKAQQGGAYGHDRFRQNLALMLARGEGDSLGAAHYQTVRVFKSLFSRTDVEVHPFYTDNDGLIIDQVRTALETNKLRIASASCPDYSGTMVDDGSGGGRMAYKYDFANLNTGTGVTSRRGLGFVKALHEVLGDEGVTVRFDHFEGTYEVAEGFKSKSGEDGDLTYDEAVRRLRASGEAVTAMYAEHGISVNSRATCDVVDDHRFRALKAEALADILNRAENDPAVARFLQRVAQKRGVLYAEWHPPTEDEGSATSTAYRNRLARELIPAQLAEYELLAEILRGQGLERQGTLIVCYDSPLMWEWVADRHPIFYGKGKGADDYVGQE